ncbi:ATP-binding protein [Streptomyces sp. NPDC001380]|uniref:ATP-binding protein n=1 Tax=Streptomyces sp. NPDC001380 TaxID=3364566 RepID=UPI0036C2C8E4
MCGPSGTGKWHLTEALGQAVIEAGMTSAWYTTEDLGVLVRHRADDSIAWALARLIRSDLVIVDDTGLLPVPPDAAEGFYRQVGAAYGRRAMAVRGDLRPSEFEEIVPRTWPSRRRPPRAPRPHRRRPGWGLPAGPGRLRTGSEALRPTSPATTAGTYLAAVGEGFAAVRERTRGRPQGELQGR